MEAKFGLRIRDSKPSDTDLREHSDPIGVLAVSSLSGKGKGSSGPCVGCFECDGALNFNDTTMQARTLASKNAGKQSSGKGNQGKSWSNSESAITGRGKSEENNGKIQKEQRCDPNFQGLRQRQDTENGYLKS